MHLEGGKIMAKKGEARERITLQCTVCKEENYRTEKNKKNTTDRLELNKFCPRCKKTTAHKEKK
jgi:large subunit ribosomal protein L33